MSDLSKVISRQEAVGLVQDGMTLGLLGFVTLSVPEDQRPAFDDCRCFAVSDPVDDRDKGYLLLSQDGTRLYVVECFL